MNPLIRLPFKANRYITQLNNDDITTPLSMSAMLQARWFFDGGSMSADNAPGYTLTPEGNYSVTDGILTFNSSVGNSIKSPFYTGDYEEGFTVYGVFKIISADSLSMIFGDQGPGGSGMGFSMFVSNTVSINSSYVGTGAAQQIFPYVNDEWFFLAASVTKETGAINIKRTDSVLTNKPSTFTTPFTPNANHPMGLGNINYGGTATSEIQCAEFGTYGKPLTNGMLSSVYSSAMSRLADKLQ